MTKGLRETREHAARMKQLQRERNAEESRRRDEDLARARSLAALLRKNGVRTETFDGVEGWLLLDYDGAGYDNPGHPALILTPDGAAYAGKYGAVRRRFLGETRAKYYAMVLSDGGLGSKLVVEVCYKHGLEWKSEAR